MSPQKSVTPSAEGIEASVPATNSGKLPPIHLWNPPFSGDIDIRIARDGTWFHEGGEIKRFKLARLFSTILKREGDEYFLVTPVEKVRIQVEDAPFVAVDFEAEGSGDAQILRFETNMGDKVAAGADNPIRVEKDAETGEPSPYVHVRAGLEALIDRKSFYRLAETGAHHDGWFGVWSSGEFFKLAPSDEMS